MLAVERPNTNLPGHPATLVLGELNVDLVLQGDVVPEFGQREKWLEGASLALGSSGAIFACGTSRLGLFTAYLGRLGQDTFGRFVVERMAERGVDVSSILVDREETTGISVILSRGQDRAILTYLGRGLDRRDADTICATLGGFSHLHVSSYFLNIGLQPILSEVFQLAKGMGLSTSLDPNWDPAQEWNGRLVTEVLPHTDIFFPNENEAQAISGVEGVEAAAERLAGKAKIVVVKRGLEGAMARWGSKVCSFPALPVESIDSTGAGDSFDAGFLCGYLNGWPLRSCLALGCASGALSTTRIGGPNGQPTLQEALTLLEERGYSELIPPR